MNWRMVIAFVLILPVWGDSGLPPFWSAIDLAQHHVEVLDDEHCDVSCPHPVSLIDPPHRASALDGLCYEPVFHEQLIAPLPPPHLAREHPPPLFFSRSHSLRAPPTLIPA